MKYVYVIGTKISSYALQSIQSTFRSNNFWHVYSDWNQGLQIDCKYWDTVKLICMCGTLIKILQGIGNSRHNDLSKTFLLYLSRMATDPEKCESASIFRSWGCYIRFDWRKREELSSNPMMFRKFSIVTTLEDLNENAKKPEAKKSIKKRT